MYDARGGGSQSSNNTVFGVAVIGVIVAAFAAVFLWPSESTSSDSPAPMAQKTEPAQIHAAFKSKEERAVVKSIAKIDPAAYARIENRLASGAVNDAKRDEIILTEFSTIIMDNIDVIGKADVKHFDAILADIRSGLKQASRSDSKLCLGKTYSSLQGMNQRQVESFMRKELMNNQGVRSFGLQMTQRMLDAVADARKKPVNHGAMEPSDERALQGLAMSLVTQPEIMMLAMAANSGADPEAALANTNICQLSIAALKAVDTLPDRTKGRLWAQAFEEVQKNGGLNFDPESMSALRGF